MFGSNEVSKGMAIFSDLKILGLILLLSTDSLFAQETISPDTIRQLEEVMVTYQADRLTPVSFQNLKGADLKLKSTGQEPSFLFSETPSVTVYSDAGSTQGYSYFRMRGIDQTRINISLDGVPLNEPEDQGAYFSNYPDMLNSVSKIQIQRGVGTSKNGTASYGGSVQLFSPNLHDSAKTTLGFGYGSFNSLRAFAEFNSGVVNRKALYVRASQIYSDGYKYNSSNNSKSVFVSSGLFYGKTTWKINLLAGHQQNQLAWLGVADSLIEKDRRTNANKDERDDFTQCLGQLENKWQLTPASVIQSSVYYTYLKGNYDFNLNGFLGLPTTNEMYNYAFQSNLVGFFTNHTWSKKNLTITTGVHGNRYNRQHIGSERTNGVLYTNTGYKNEVSVFSKAEYEVNHFSFFADLQYRHASFDYKGDASFGSLKWDFVNPKAGISYEINQHAVLYYSIGKTGREPTRNDMFGGNDNLQKDVDGNSIISITAPESVVNQELGVRHQTGNTNFDLNFYCMDFKNEIVLDGKFGPNGLALTNKVDKSYRTGLEIQVKQKMGRYFSFINSSSFNYSRIKEQGETFKPILTPPIIINQEVTFSNKRFLVGVAVRYQDRSYIDFANSGTIDNYVIVNTRIQLDWNKFQFSVFANNITNTKYFNNGYVDYDGSKKYFVQAPPNCYASIKYSL